MRHSLACTCSPVCRDRHARYERGRNHDARHGRPRIVDGTGTRRRLQALLVQGWTCQHIADAGDGWRPGIPGRDAVQKLVQQDRVRSDIAARVAAVYARLADYDGPSGHTRERARRRGWLPSEAWAPDQIDDPAGRPWTALALPDMVLMERMRHGTATLQDLRELRGLPLGDRVALADAWLAAGRSLAALERAGWNPHRDRTRCSGMVA